MHKLVVHLSDIAVSGCSTLSYPPHPQISGRYLSSNNNALFISNQLKQHSQLAEPASTSFISLKKIPIIILRALNSIYSATDKFLGYAGSENEPNICHRSNEHRSATNRANHCINRDKTMPCTAYGAIYKKPLLCVILLSFALSLCYAEQVSWAGFCFTGNNDNIPVNFKYTISNKQAIQNDLRSFFTQNSEFYNFTLDTTNRNTDSKLSLAVTMNRESVDFETIGDNTKVIYNLWLSVYILDFGTMNIVQSYPFKTSFIDISGRKPSDKEIEATMLNLIRTDIMKKFQAKASLIAIKSPNSRSMKVAHVSFLDAALPYLGIYQTDPETYATILANQVTESFAYDLNVTMLPYGKDVANQKMSLAFSDGSVQNFTIPTSSYDVDLKVTNFVKLLYKETAVERVDTYGAYINLRIYDGELNTEYWAKDIKYGAYKQTVVDQEVSDFANFNEVLLQTIAKESINTIKQDKKLMKGVISKCVNY